MAQIDRAARRRLGLGYAALVGVTYGLIVLGALVRAHGAGLSCPDWPLCFGELVPRMDVKIAFEWGHRLLASGVSLGFVALAFGCLRNPSLRPLTLRLIAVSGFILVVQILLGALTVWQLLASWTVTSHLIVGNALAVSFLLTAQRLLEAPRERAIVAGSIRAAVVAVAALLAVQMVLGGLVSSGYAGLACTEWPTCMNGEWASTFEGAQGLHLLHRFNGYALLAALAALALAARRSPLAVLANATLLLAVAQVGVGVANVLLRLPVEITALHSALAAALVLAVAAAVREAFRRP